MANFYDNDPANEIFFKFIAIPFFVLIMIGYTIDQFSPEKNYSNYKWETYEDRYKRDFEKERKWAIEQGLEWKLDSWKKATSIPDNSKENLSDDLETAEPNSSLFREYMEELDDRGIGPGSPEAVEIWETYYK